MKTESVNSLNTITREAPSFPTERVALFTFDVFDTLLTRIWLRPADVFLHIEHLHVRAGWQAGIDRWSARRIAAEARVRDRVRDGEATLEQIYEELALELAWSGDDARRALAIEMECEVQASRPIAPMVRRFDSLVGNRIRVACVSDFYASRSFVRDLLARSGVRIGASDLFVSSDEQVTKRTGALFHRVSKHYGLQPAQICHTGDHPRSDVQQAKNAGVTVQPYLRSAPSATESLLASWGFETRDRLIASAIGGAARRARIDREVQGRDDVLWNVATGIAGPLLFGYVYWILFRAQELGIRRLYFLARDGQILLQIARQISGRHAFDLDLRYLHASRRAWFLPSTARGSAEDRANAILSDESVVISDLLHDLEISAADVRQTLETAGFPEEVWARPVQADRLKRVLSEHPFDSLISERASRGLTLCMQYLTDEGMLDGVPGAIVDIGWKGRLQAALARMLSGLNLSKPVGFYMGLRTRPDKSTIGSAYVYVDGQDAGMLNPSLVEVFSAANHGSTLGYERLRDGRMSPILAGGHEACLEWGLETLTDGINAFCANMIDSLGVLNEEPLRVIGGLRRAALLSMQRLVSRPTPAEAMLLGTFPHAAGQFHQDTCELAPPLPISSLLRAFLNPAALLARTHWPQASIARSTPVPELAARLWELRVEGIPRLKKRLWRMSRFDSRTEV